MPFMGPPTGTLMPMYGPLDTVTIIDHTDSTWQPDSEGRSTTQTYPTYQITGRLMQLSTQELANLGRFGEGVTAVFIAPLTVKVTDRDELVAAGIDPRLDGTYEISSVRYTPMHIRILLRETV